MAKLGTSICAGFVLACGMTGACAKSGPMQLGSVLSPYSKINTEVAEIAAYMPEQKLLFAVGDSNVLGTIDLSNPSKPAVKSSFYLDGEATSVTVHGNLIATSLLANPAWEDGFVEVMEYASAGVKKIETYKVCSHPDMITFTPDGKMLLVACEGEPSEDGKIDPIGGVAIVSVNDASGKLAPSVKVIPFEDKSIEPEYITVSGDSKWAWVSLQENNAIARIDLQTKSLDGIFDLGFVDHSKPGFGIDAVKDGKIRIENANLRGLRQPDGIKFFAAEGKSYVVTANEGAPVKDFDKRTVCGDDAKCDVKFGSRSVSVFDGFSGELQWDSGDLLERTFAKVAPEYFNWNSKKGKKKVDARSDDMGCEPENVTIGMVNGKRLAFVGLERMSGIAVFDITNVSAPKLVDYYLDPADRGPEGMLFIDAEKSPIPGQPILVVSYEYSKTLVVYTIK